MMAVMRATGAACPASIGTAGAIRTIGERGLEHTLQLSRLVAGHLAAGDFALNEVVDLRFEIARRRLGAARLVAGLARFTRRIDLLQPPQPPPLTALPA